MSGAGVASRQVRRGKSGPARAKAGERARRGRSLCPGCACLASKPSSSLALSTDTKKGVSRKGKKPWPKQRGRTRRQ